MSKLEKSRETKVVSCLDVSSWCVRHNFKKWYWLKGFSLSNINWRSHTLVLIFTCQKVYVNHIWNVNKYTFRSAHSYVSFTFTKCCFFLSLFLHLHNNFSFLHTQTHTKNEMEIYLTGNMRKMYKFSLNESDPITFGNLSCNFRFFLVNFFLFISLSTISKISPEVLIKKIHFWCTIYLLKNSKSNFKTMNIIR